MKKFIFASIFACSGLHAEAPTYNFNFYNENDGENSSKLSQKELEEMNAKLLEKQAKMQKIIGEMKQALTSNYMKGIENLTTLEDKIKYIDKEPEPTNNLEGQHMEKKDAILLPRHGSTPEVAPLNETPKPEQPTPSEDLEEKPMLEEIPSAGV